MAFVTYDVGARVLRIGKNRSDIEDYTDVIMIYDIAKIRHGDTCKDGGYWLTGFDKHSIVKCIIANVREVETIGIKNDT